MLIKKMFLAATVYVLSASLPAFCFADFMDGERDGFIFNMAAGGSSIVYKQYVRKGSPDTITTADSWDINPAFSLGGEIGYGFTKQLQLLLMNDHAYLYKIDNINGKKVGMENSLVSIGGCYFLNPESPSFYINSGIGLSFLSSSGDEDSDMSGLGIRIGLGYEFTQNIAVDFSTVYTTNYIEESYADANVNSIILTLGMKMLFY